MSKLLVEVSILDAVLSFDASLLLLNVLLFLIFGQEILKLIKVLTETLLLHEFHSSHHFFWLFKLKTVVVSEMLFFDWLKIWP